MTVSLILKMKRRAVSTSVKVISINYNLPPAKHEKPVYVKTFFPITIFLLQSLIRMFKSWIIFHIKLFGYSEFRSECVIMQKQWNT